MRDEAWCEHHAKRLDLIDAEAAKVCLVCGAETQGEACRRCADVAVLEVGVDPGADGAYAFDCDITFDDGPGRMSNVCSIGADERVVKGAKTKAGKAKVRRLASAECLALELTALIQAVRVLLAGRPLRLIAHLEVPAPAPAQSSVTTASQHRSLGRIEGVLVALGFEIDLLTTQRWHAVLGIVSAKPSGSEREGLKDDARRREGKIVSTALARQLRPDLEDRIGEDDNRAEAVLVMIAGRKLRHERETR